jgi:hypothetical protein
MMRKTENKKQQKWKINIEKNLMNKKQIKKILKNK